MPERLKVINVGLGAFSSVLAELGVPHVEVEWKPPAQGDPELADLLFRLILDFRDESGGSRIESANREAFRRLLAAEPILRRVRPAHACLPAMDKHTLLHAGPPIAWPDMCEPMRGAVNGALRYEGLAESPAEAEALLDSGRIHFLTTHSQGVVAPMAGIVSHSMPLLEVENAAFGNLAYAPLNEGVGHVLRFGANGPLVIRQLVWLEKVLAPALDGVVRKAGGVGLKSIMARALLMGDEMHQRNAAASLAFYQAVGPELLEVAASDGELKEIMTFLTRGNEQFFLNLAMAAAKSALDPARDIPYSSLITSMSRNGVDFGINVSALGGQWITAPSLHPRGLYFPGFGEEDANPDLGDSAIIECYGLGGFAMAAAPTVARFLGAGNFMEALAFTLDMSHITLGQNADLPIPGLDFAGAPTGIDLLRVAATGILPVINSGVAHRRAGMGQVGAGLTTPPMEAIIKALRLLYQRLADY